MTLEYRFRIKFIIQENGCWIWIGFKDKYGRGQVTINHRTYLASRVARHIYCGFDLNSELQVNHKIECNNQTCVNPDHTYEGTQSDNMKDRSKLATHCKNGHEFIGNNIYIKPNGRKGCRTCRISRSREFREQFARSRLLL